MVQDSYRIEYPDDTTANFEKLETAVASIREKLKAITDDRENAQFYHGTILIKKAAGPIGVGGHTSTVAWRAFAEGEGWARQPKELDYETDASGLARK